MAEFETKCPHCQSRLWAQDVWIGMTVECPTCKSPFTIQRPGPAQPTLSAPRPPYNTPPRYGQPQQYGPPPYGQPQQYGPPQYGSQPINPASRKSRSVLFLLNLVIPGAGQIYLGQTGKGLIFLLLFLFLLLPVCGALTMMKGLTFLGRLLFVVSCAWVFGDSFYILTKIELGLPVDPMEFSSPSKSKALEPLMTPEMKKSNRKYSIAALVCLLLGFTLPGILGTIALIAEMTQ